MFEIVVCSLFVGSLGLQAVVISNWMRWQQNVEVNQHTEEEETLAPDETQEYTSMEPANGSSKQLHRDPRLVGWEFKIVRANRNLFREPAIFQQLCEEEAEAGWLLLEKLDDSRVRFKRPVALREIIKPEFLSYDPYRCYYGSAWQARNWLIAIATLVAIALPAYLGYALVSQTLTSNSVQNLPVSFPPREPKPNP